MKQFYIFTLLVGLILAVIVQFVDIALPRDAYIASILSKVPEQWSIQMNDDLNRRLLHFDAKKELVVTLQKRAGFINRTYAESFFGGLILIALSIIGLVREDKIEKLKKAIKATSETVEESSQDADS
jgi:hypothetical protein